MERNSNFYRLLGCCIMYWVKRRKIERFYISYCCLIKWIEYVLLSVIGSKTKESAWKRKLTKCMLLFFTTYWLCIFYELRPTYSLYLLHQILLLLRKMIAKLFTYNEKIYQIDCLYIEIYFDFENRILFDFTHMRMHFLDI